MAEETSGKDTFVKMLGWASHAGALGTFCAWSSHQASV